MPGTDERAVTLRDIEIARKTNCLFLGQLLLRTALASLVIVWLLREALVGYVPSFCFRVLESCQVLSITYSLLNDTQQCVDVFRYQWSPEGSPLIFNDTERLSRSTASCQDPTFNPFQRATFALGETSCFQLDGTYADFSQVFSCQLPFPNCYTLFPPTSSITVLLGVQIPILLVLCIAPLYDPHLDDGRGQNEQ